MKKRELLQSAAGLDMVYIIKRPWKPYKPHAAIAPLLFVLSSQDGWAGRNIKKQNKNSRPWNRLFKGRESNYKC